MAAWSVRLWRWWANAAGVAVVAIAGAYGLVYALEGNGEVWIGDNLEVLTPMVQSGGRVAFTLSVLPNESCPGEVVTTLKSVASAGPPATVEQRRPLMRPGIPLPRQIFEFDLPPAVAPGEWDVSYAVDSNCPLRRRVDEVARFRILVTR